jgi:hypothetical protein
MRSYFSFIVLAFLLLAVVCLTGCSTTSSTIYEFDAKGKVIKKTVTKEKGAIDKLVESTKKKSVIAWSDGWIAYISVSTATTEDPTPTGKISAGKVAKGYISLLPNQENLDKVAEIIKATRTSLSVSSSGISSGSDTEVKDSNADTEETENAAADIKATEDDAAETAVETTKEAAAAAEVKD